MKIEKNTLFYGDNLPILRNYVEDESIDLIYLDPPFNSQRSYNIIFKERTGNESPAQIKAFDDFWRWDRATEETYREIADSAPANVVRLIKAFVDFLGRNDVTAYVVMMTIRLLEFHRVLKKTGSIYLHCDPTASHYLKIVMDQIFDARHFRREVIWRTGGVSGFKSRAKNWVRNHDVLLYFTKSDYFTFNKLYMPHPKDYERRGGGEQPKGVAIDDVWADIYSPYIMSFSKEKLGYQTQKPLDLLRRIIKASSNEGDWVLDPFCGCGTTIIAAHELGRHWIGIDITHLAVSLMKYRLNDMFGDIDYDVIGEPVDLPSARALAEEDPWQFQWWALSLVKGRPVGSTRKKGADKGVDGVIYFIDEENGKPKEVVIQVKSGHVGVQQLRELCTTVNDRNAALGVFITLEDPTGPMRRQALAQGYYERPGFQKKYPKIQILTIQELLAGRQVEMPFPESKKHVSFEKAKPQKKKPEDFTEKLL